jgi:hypothetical protein
MPNTISTVTGSYTDQNKVKQSFEVEAEVYSNDADGFDMLVEEYGTARIIAIVNKNRETLVINAERTRLTEFRNEIKNNKANAFDELMAATTEEEKQAIATKYGLA